MAAKTKTVQTKGSKKASKPTPVKKVTKGKKPVVKKPKKPVQKKVVVTEKMHEDWFFKLDKEYFVKLCEEWNEKNFKIRITKQDNYDQWLNYFKKLSPTAVRALATSGVDILPTEGYAALRRWHDILSHPARIDKIHQAGLTNRSGTAKGQDIVTLAKNGDRMGVLCAIRDRIAEKLEKGAGARDTASLSREMGDILDQIAELERKSGPKSGTKLNSLLGDFNAQAKRKPGAGARNTSYKSRITIDDKEGA